MGQVVSTNIGHLQISGVGGQVDFVVGSQLSKNGRSIIAMPSTIKGASKIVPFIDEGSAVTTSRYDAHYIVTEYGIADMRGATLFERARRLIGIAHPSHQGRLIDFFESKFKRAYVDN
jgi:4-hydroxybutyrate CoA-transferase